ncbi:single-stranded DNA-binding protein [Miniphocaeibacter massiliensis]|uniref:single-stranded DNA-binding protein n=1 Tax=Miniphocaeibacter massiliensis TaxID=2041841 RepID=UPI000C1C1003|nr:single-stranded DNA-binding protein [Miniphocaeibacter massiliensis]
MNNVCLIGRLTRSPELRYTNSGKAMCRFTVAISRELSKEKKRELESLNKQTADFINCIAWGKTAELIASYMDKGSQVGVNGKLQTSFVEKEGRKIYKTEVLVERVEFLESVKKDESVSENSYGFEDDAFLIGDDDIPF